MKPGFRNVFLAILSAAGLPLLMCHPAALAQEAAKTENLKFMDGRAKVDSTLKTSDETDKVRKNECKIFTVDFKSGHNYKIDMVSKDIDSYLRLEDATGKELAKDDDSGGFVNARIHFYCTVDGVYRVICTTFAGGTGPFTLTIQETAIAQPVKLDLKDGMAKVDDKLTDKDQADAARTHSVCKTYAINLTKGKSYQLDMMSKDVDSFLRIEDATGKELAKDDDSGGDHNARIQFECPADGTYRIVATTFFGGVGSFTLTVKAK